MDEMKAFLEVFYAACAKGPLSSSELQKATDLIFECVDQWFLEDRFDEVDWLLANAEVERLNSFITDSFLTTTFWAKDKLPSRAGFWQRTHDWLMQIDDPARVHRLLDRLN